MDGVRVSFWGYAPERIIGLVVIAVNFGWLFEWGLGGALMLVKGENDELFVDGDGGGNHC